MANVELSKTGSIFVLTLNDPATDNTYTTDVLKNYHACLDEIEGSKGNACLLITSNNDKTWCNGINLNWFIAQNQDERDVLVSAMERLYLRLSLLNMPTLGCLTGNTYAGGAIMACALDFRYMRADKGRFCFSEVDIKIPFTPLMTEVIRLLPNPHALHEMALTGLRLGGEECFARNIVDGIYPADSLRNAALERAEFLASKDRSTYTAIKHGLRRHLLTFRTDNN